MVMGAGARLGLRWPRSVPWWNKKPVQGLPLLDNPLTLGLSLAPMGLTVPCGSHGPFHSRGFLADPLKETGLCYESVDSMGKLWAHSTYQCPHGTFSTHQPCTPCCFPALAKVRTFHSGGVSA